MHDGGERPALPFDARDSAPVLPGGLARSADRVDIFHAGPRACIEHLGARVVQELPDPALRSAGEAVRQRPADLRPGEPALQQPQRKRNGTSISTSMASHVVMSEKVCHIIWVAMLSAKRASVAPPANSTGLRTRRAAGLERCQRRASVTTTARRNSAASAWTPPVTKSAATGLSQRRNALSGQSSQLSSGCRSTKRIGRVANAVASTRRRRAHAPTATRGGPLDRRAGGE